MSKVTHVTSYRNTITPVKTEPVYNEIPRREQFPSKDKNVCYS